MNTYKVLLVAPDGRRYYLSVDEDQNILEAARLAGLNFPQSGFLSWCISNSVTVNKQKENCFLNFDELMQDFSVEAD